MSEEATRKPVPRVLLLIRRALDTIGGVEVTGKICFGGGVVMCVHLDDVVEDHGCADMQVFLGEGRGVVSYTKHTS